MNALDAISEAALASGWRHLHSSQTKSGLMVSYMRAIGRGEVDWLRIHYRLYGSLGSERLCRYYGKGEGINWGVQTAVLSRQSQLRRSTSWVVTQRFEGKDKKRQILTFLKESREAATTH